MNNSASEGTLMEENNINNRENDQSMQGQKLPTERNVQKFRKLFMQVMNRGFNLLTSILVPSLFPSHQIGNPSHKTILDLMDQTLYLI